MNASIQHAGDSFFIATSDSGHSQVFDTKGERKSAATPVEALLMALGACTGADVISILAKKREKVLEYRIEVSAERREDHPRSFTTIHVRHIIRGQDLSEKAVAQAVQLSDKKYCSVAAALRPTAEITSGYEIIQDTGIGEAGEG